MSRPIPALAARRRAACAALALAPALIASAVLARPAAAADGPVGLGTAGSFAVLAGAGITNTGPTTINGDVGTFPTTTRSGFASVTLIGTDHGGDEVTQGAKDDLVTAYDDAAGRAPATPVAVELGGSTLLAGVYTSGELGLTGTLTLDAEGRADAQFVFQAGTTLITEADSRVVLVNGASPCNVVWQVGSSATFKTRTQFAGDVLAYASITAQTSATFAGRLLARDGAVTMDTNTISNAACASGGSGGTPTPTPGASSPPPTSTPTPRASVSVAPATAATPRAAGPAGGAGSTAPRTSGGARGVPSGGERLPETGLRVSLTISGLASLALGLAALAAGRTTGLAASGMRSGGILAIGAGGRHRLRRPERR